MNKTTDEKKQKFGQKKLKFHTNKISELNKQSYTIDSYRNKKKDVSQNHTNSFYNKNKKHGRCDSALQMEETERDRDRGRMV